MNKEQLISEILLLPAKAIDYHINQHLRQIFPGRAFIENDGHINIQGFSEAQHCTLTGKNCAYNQWSR